MAENPFVTELASRLGAPLLLDSAEIEPFTRDFSGLRSLVPLAVARPSTETEFADTFVLAARHGIEVKLRGAGHSSNGQTLTEGGLVVHSLEPGGEVLFDPVSGLADLPARATWWDVQNQLTAQGRSCPVLTDYLFVSVGGTLSVGGYGARSIAYGAQIDNVERLRVILRNGDALWCSSRERSDVFRLVLAGQGALGAIERAVIRTIPYRRQARVYGFEHRSLTELAESLAWLEDWEGPRPDLFVGAQRFGAGNRSIVAQFGFDIEENRPIDPFMLTPLAARKPAWIEIHPTPELRAHARTIDLLEDHAGCVRVWSDYMFGYAGFVEFTRFTEQLLEDARFRTHLSVIGLLIHRSPSDKVDFLFEASRASLGRHKYMLGFYFFVPSDDTQGISYLREVARQMLERCLAVGGRPYRYGLTDLTEPQRTELFGNADEELTTILSSNSVR